MMYEKLMRNLFGLIILCILIVAILPACFRDAGCRSGNIAINSSALTKSISTLPDSSLPSDFKFTIQDLLNAVCGSWVDTTSTVKMEIKAIAGSSLSYNVASEGSKCGSTRTAIPFSCTIDGQDYNGEFNTGMDLNGSELFVVDSLHTMLIDLSYFKNVSNGSHEFLMVEVAPEIDLSVDELLIKPF
jgi:hypothetical protein